MLVYSNAQLIIDLPAIRSRSLPWMIWRSNANGTGFQGWGSGADSNPSLRWLMLSGHMRAETGWYGSTKCAAGQFNQWKSNPWTTGNSATTSHGETEPAGYTSLVYPPRPGVDDQTRFVPSIRW